MATKTCGSCVNCEKYTINGERWWVCENYVKSVGMPVTVSPPGDAACENWSDDPADKDKPQDALRYFVDHYWDEEDLPILDAAPMIDAVSVIRCKDCRYFKMYKCRMGYSSHNDFCYYGERKSEEGIK